MKDNTEEYMEYKAEVINRTLGLDLDVKEQDNIPTNPHGGLTMDDFIFEKEIEVKSVEAHDNFFDYELKGQIKGCYPLKKVVYAEFFEKSNTLVIHLDNNVCLKLNEASSHDNDKTCEATFFEKWQTYLDRNYWMLDEIKEAVERFVDMYERS